MKLTIEQTQIGTIKPSANNTRLHSKKQIGQVARSIKRFGFTFPILIDGEGNIIAGHCRYEAARSLGLKEVPTLCRGDLSEAEIKAYMIADNKLAENASWNRQQLALELIELGDLSSELDLEITDTGFDIPEIDLVIQESLGAPNEDRTDPADVLPDIADGMPVTRLGDVWDIGEHRLICGDAKDPQTYNFLLGDLEAQMVFTDPPYNVPINGHVSGKGKAQHEDFHEASGEMSDAEFTQFLRDVFERCADATVDGSMHFICMDWRHMQSMLAAGHGTYTELKNLCVWAKSNGGMGSLYRSQHELVFVFKSGKAQHINNIQLGRFGRNRTNLWEYNGMNSFGRGRDEALLSHPTVKPVALVADALLDCSTRGSIVLDPFVGSGTTLLAAHRTGRRGFGVEIDPKYCDLIINRMQTACNLDAFHTQSGQCFADLKFSRSSENSSTQLQDNSSSPGATAHRLPDAAANNERD